MRHCGLVVFAAIVMSNTAAADDLHGSAASNRKLAFIIPNLYGSGGLTLPNQEHVAHFDSAFQTSFAPFNSAIAGQLSSLPIPSPASGFTYTFDKSLGVATRSAQSFGPILGERAETIGKDKFYFGFAYQLFRFDSIDGVPLHRVPAVFQHSEAVNPEFAKDLITTNNFLDLNVGQFTTFVTYGLLDRMDVSVAAPLITSSLTVTSDAKIQRIGTRTDTSIHFFPTQTGDRSQQQFHGASTATGLGDVIVRVKGTVLRGHSAALALGLDLRAPTGDEYNFLGSGAMGAKPFLALSFKAGRVSPHLNGAFQWNGKSVLAGNVVTGRKGKLPNEFSYVAGADIGVTRKFTLATDILGQVVSNAPLVRLAGFTAADGSRFPNIRFVRGRRQPVNLATGFKINGVGNLLVAFNVLYKLNDDGLRGRVTPMIGISYTF
jgi:hypothetical protein